MREAAHAGGLVLADLPALFDRDENHGVVGCLERLGKTFRDPAPRPFAILGRNPEVLALHTNIELHRVLARLDPRIGDLAFRTRFEAAQEGVLDRRTVEPG